ncbi:hypothetical protein TNCV_2856941 [Trichonephila clavipes]|nr:hypothetical protein TNCV_2856941 [Trichonephila clavipes]
MLLLLLLTPHDRQRPDRGPQISSWQRAQRRRSLAVALSTLQVTVRFGSVPPQFRGRILWGWSEAFQFSFPSTNLTRGLVARRLFTESHAAKALYIYKHPCLLRDSNPDPMALQSASLTIIPDG